MYLTEKDRIHIKNNKLLNHKKIKENKEKVAKQEIFAQKAVLRAQKGAKESKKREDIWSSRVQEITEMAKNGMNKARIAEHYGVSRERMRQVFSRFNIKSSYEYKKEKNIEIVKNLKLDKYGVESVTELLKNQYKKFLRKKYNCKKANIPFTVKFKDIYWPFTCPILGTELNYDDSVSDDTTPSFDRINPKLGYIAGNVSIISKRANRIKNDGTAEEHEAIAAYMRLNGES